MDETLRQLVWDRAGDTCEYKHHGPTSAENLALCCYNDNVHKGPNIAGIDPVTREVTRLFNPRADHWDDHFAWNGPQLVGRTPIGRSTIDVLNINLFDRLEHRRLLIKAGLLGRKESH
jgi:hypothetical protein